MVQRHQLGHRHLLRAGDCLEAGGRRACPMPKPKSLESLRKVTRRTKQQVRKSAGVLGLWPKSHFMYASGSIALVVWRGLV